MICLDPFARQAYATLVRTPRGRGWFWPFQGPFNGPARSAPAMIREGE